MLTVILDLQMTRRKRTHTVIEPDGEPLFSASRFSDIIEWLYEREVPAFNVETDDGESFRLSLTSTRTVLTDFLKDAETASV